jgi:hypothetical protein
MERQSKVLVESPSTVLRTGETGKGRTFTVRLPMGGGKEDPWRKNRVS